MALNAFVPHMYKMEHLDSNNYRRLSECMIPLTGPIWIGSSSFRKRGSLFCFTHITVAYTLFTKPKLIEMMLLKKQGKSLMKRMLLFKIPI